MKTRVTGRWEHACRLVAGAGLCAALAMLVAAWAPHPTSPTLPLIFLPVVFALALRYGTGAGVLGASAAALVFALWLYSPVGSLSVGNEAARQSLAWMLLGSLVFSYLLASPRAGRQ